MRINRNYLLTVLTVILAFNYTDRFALGLVSQDIKVDLHLSDSELGFLSGIAFALFYSVMGIPIARWADRGDRLGIIGITTALWSVAVALCGLAANFTQLMLIRVLVGIGEAGCVPPAHSLIADMFNRKQRPRAVSLYMQGISFSLVIGYFVAGWLNQYVGWRGMFLVIGLPGIILAAWARLSFRDPRESARSDSAAARSSRASVVEPTVKEVCVTLWGNHTFRRLLYAYSVLFFFSYGTLQWTPAFFVRSFGMKTGELGTWFAVIYGVGGLLGTYWGGEWVARYAAANERRQLRAMAVVGAISGVFAAFVYVPALAPNSHLALVWLALSNLVSVTLNGPLFSVLQTLVPGRMRAMSIALVYLTANLVGLGFGPWAAGALSDALQPLVGEESLRYSMLLLCPGFLWGAWYLWSASKTVTQDVNEAQIGISEEVVDESHSVGVSSQTSLG